MKYLSILLIACLCLNVAAYAWVQSKEEADANYKKHRRIYNLQRCDMMINWPDVYNSDDCKEYRELREKCTPEARNNIPDCKFVTATK
jgi:hypothetical protein